MDRSGRWRPRLCFRPQPLGCRDPGRHAAGRRPWRTEVRLRLLLACAGAFLLRAEAARAGAWNEPAGEGLVILRGGLEAGSYSFDRKGKLVRTDSYMKRELSAYLQYGLTDKLQIIVKPDLVWTSTGGSHPASYRGFGTSEAGAQFNVLDVGHAVFALQGTFHLPATTRQSNLALIGNTSRDTDGRGLLGVSFALGPWPAFLDAEAGYRIRSAHAPDEIHVDLTLGARPRPDLLLMVQSFTTVPTGRGAAWFPASQYTNAGGSVVYDLNERWSLQLGLFTTIAGRDALRERVAETSIWYRF